jgi:hypothetical protein
LYPLARVMQLRSDFMDAEGFNGRTN